ncbi:MAG: sulfatase-like hydrolase/transferase [Acidobacteria bacterium]|nr:sulfatase-like hydrolase/transferase [Acidobacteriota bacterium]
MPSRPDSPGGTGRTPVPAVVAGLLAALALLLVVSGCPGHARRFDNLVLVTLDTLRADHVSCYGSTRVQTPNIDALARDGARAVRAWSTTPLTTPAHASIMTGLYPPGHGVRNNARFRLPADVTTLAQVLSGSGRRTAAFVASFTTSSMFGFNRGFDVFDDDMGNDSSGTQRSQRPGDQVVNRAILWLRQNADRPFFLWVHLFDPHEPYNAPVEFASRHPGDPYSGEVAFTDAQVGRLMEELRAAGVAPRTAIVAVADHGEGLDTHGEDEHGLLLYQETVEVPMIYVAPGVIEPGTEIAGAASLVDVMPTALALLGQAAPAGVHGIDLFGPGADPARHVYAETLYPYEEFGWSALYALRERDLKYIASPSPELYDVAADPREGTNLAGTRTDEARALASALRETAMRLVDPERLAAAAGFGAESDPETISRLESLGYVAGGGAAAGPGEALPAVGGRNPRDAMLDYGRFRRAQELIRAGQPAEAVKLYEKLRETDPANPQVMLKLAQALETVGQTDRAEDAYRELIARHPVFYLGYRSFATFLEGLGRPREARDLWLRLLGLLPGYVGVEVRLAQTEISAGMLDEAIARMSTHLAEHAKDANAWAQMGRARLSQGNRDQALEAFRTALEIHPTQWEALDGAVAILVDSGRVDEARKLLQSLRSRAPNDPAIRHAFERLNQPAAAR